MTSIHEGILNLPILPKAARHSHLLPYLMYGYLISVVSLMESSCKELFTRTLAFVLHQRHVALTACRCSTCDLRRVIFTTSNTAAPAPAASVSSSPVAPTLNITSATAAPYVAPAANISDAPAAPYAPTPLPPAILRSCTMLQGRLTYPRGSRQLTQVTSLTSPDFPPPSSSGIPPIHRHGTRPYQPDLYEPKFDVASQPAYTATQLVQSRSATLLWRPSENFAHGTCTCTVSLSW